MGNGFGMCNIYGWDHDMLNVSEIVSSRIEMKYIYRGLSLLPYTWNNGMMEEWNVGF